MDGAILQAVSRLDGVGVRGDRWDSWQESGKSGHFTCYLRLPGDVLFSLD